VATIKAGEREVKMNLATAIKEENGAMSVTDTMSTPMGNVTDTATLDKNTLIVLNRSVRQGQVAIDLTFKDNKATGTMKMGEENKPVAVDLGGPLFADGAGSSQVIATLPLADGYTAAFRNFDIQKQKPKLMQLAVDGSESVTVPAGKFEAFKVQLTSAEGGTEKATLWIAKDSRKMVRLAAVMPDMGGASLTAELVP
jgi:hypothetical protein